MSHTGPTLPEVHGMWRDFNSAAFWAGITALLWYVLSAQPLQVAILDRLGLDQAQASSWIFII